MKLVFEALAFLSCFGYLIAKFIQLLKILGTKSEKEDKDVLA
jgi:hypothetical protein